MIANTKKGDGVRAAIGILLLVCCGAALAEDAAILRIRAEYQSLHGALKTFKTQQLEPDGGGTTTAYADAQGRIRAITDEGGGEAGDFGCEYYYHEDGRLFFVFCQNVQYNAPAAMTREMAKEQGVEAYDPKKSIVTEDRYYFEGGRMLRWVDKNRKQVAPNTPAFRDAAAQVMKESDELLGEFRKPQRAD